MRSAHLAVQVLECARINVQFPMQKSNTFERKKWVTRNSKKMFVNDFSM